MLAPAAPSIAEFLQELLRLHWNQNEQITFQSSQFHPGAGSSLLACMDADSLPHVNGFATAQLI